MYVQLDTSTVALVCAAAASRYILVHMCGDALFRSSFLNLPLGGKILTANILRVCLNAL